MRKIRGGGVRLETPEEAKVAEDLVRALPPTRSMTEPRGNVIPELERRFGRAKPPLKPVNSPR